jgi:hypothetical protein
MTTPSRRHRREVTMLAASVGLLVALVLFAILHLAGVT